MGSTKSIPPFMHHEDLEKALVECIRILARRGREIRGQKGANSSETQSETESAPAEEDSAHAARVKKGSRKRE